MFRDRLGLASPDCEPHRVTEQALGEPAKSGPGEGEHKKP